MTEATVLPRESPIEGWDDVPLFMQKLPEAENGSNDAIEALKTLLYDDTPEGQSCALFLFLYLCLSIFYGTWVMTDLGIYKESRIT
jgi:hypothetical protein